MNLTMKSEGGPIGPSGGVSRKMIAAIIASGVVGLTGVGWAVSKAFADPNTPKAAKPMTTDEAKLAVKGEEAKVKAAKEGERLKQTDVGGGIQFDAQGNMIQGTPQGGDTAGLSNMALDQIKSPVDRASITEGIQKPPSSLGVREPQNLDPTVMRETREAKKEERTENSSPMLGYSTSRSASWALRRPEAQDATQKKEKSSEQADSDQIAINNQAISKLTELTERAVNQAGQESGPAVEVNVSNQGQGAPGASPGASAHRVTPAQVAAQVAAPGEIADMRVGTGIGRDMVVREGKFLDCALVNRVESDINDSPVILQVTRDFVSPDGRYVLVPAGAKVYGVAGSVQSMQQARLYMAFHRVVYPTRHGENESLSAYFPKRLFPAMDHMGSLGVKDKLNRHFFLQFGSAIMLGLFDGAAASVQSAGAEQNPTMRDLMLARTSQNFASIVNSVIQRYANVVPTVTIREGKKCKVYFTQDVMMTPWMETRNLSWVAGSTGGVQ